MNIKIGILNVPKHCNKHDLIHFVTMYSLTGLRLDQYKWQIFGLPYKILGPEGLMLDSNRRMLVDHRAGESMKT